MNLLPKNPSECCGKCQDNENRCGRFAPTDCEVDDRCTGCNDKQRQVEAPSNVRGKLFNDDIKDVHADRRVSHGHNVKGQALGKKDRTVKKAKTDKPNEKAAAAVEPFLDLIKAHHSSQIREPKALLAVRKRKSGQRPTQVDHACIRGELPALNSTVVAPPTARKSNDIIAATEMGTPPAKSNRLTSRDTALFCFAAFLARKMDAIAKTTYAMEQRIKGARSIFMPNRSG